MLKSTKTSHSNHKNFDKKHNFPTNGLLGGGGGGALCSKPHWLWHCWLGNVRDFEILKISQLTSKIFGIWSEIFKAFKMFLRIFLIFKFSRFLRFCKIFQHFVIFRGFNLNDSFRFSKNCPKIFWELILPAVGLLGEIEDGDWFEMKCTKGAVSGTKNSCTLSANK